MKGNNISTQILVWTNHQVHNCRKKVQNSILGCSVQCRGDVVLWFCAFRRGSQLPGALLTQWQDCLEWEQLLPHMLVAELAQTWVGKGFDWWLFFSTSAFLRWAGKFWRAHCHRARATMCRVTRAPWSPENGTRLLPWKSSCQFKFPGVKPSHIVREWKEAHSLGTTRNKAGAPKCLLEESLLSPRGYGGSTRITILAQERFILPQSSLCFITFPPALMGTTKWRVKMEAAGESKQDYVALFRFSPLDSS